MGGGRSDEEKKEEEKPLFGRNYDRSVRCFTHSMSINNFFESL